jgi:tetratricopeptide (TPR) repeat protein
VTSLPPASLDFEVGRIRELSKVGRHLEALAAAEALASRMPHNQHAVYLVAANQRCLNRIPEALETLLVLEQQHPRFSLLYQERGYCYVSLRDAPRAIDAFQRGVNLNPALAASWQMLERLYRMSGNLENAARAAEQASFLKHLPPDVARAGSLFADGELPAAEKILRAYLSNASHVEALRLLGRIQHQRKLLDEAEQLLESAVKLAPDYPAARYDFVRALLDLQKYPQAQKQIEILLDLEPGNAEYLSLYAAACAGLGRHESAIPVYRQLLATPAASSHLHLSLGHSLQSAGHQMEAIDSYRAASLLRPDFGDAWWSLANLKTYRFSDDEMARMRAGETAPASHPVDRYHLCFALGKGHEDRGEYADSWQFYERGNSLKRAESPYRPEIVESDARRQMEVCTAEFFAARTGVGSPDADPILIVGLPRSGSTLLEQILASHSQVEGTQELPDIQRIVLELEGHDSDADHPRYPGTLAGMSSEDFRRLGQRYLAGVSAYRNKNKPYFVDKMPNNFRHIGLIHLMLPNAKIIDARRSPMACCFSNLKQLFAGGQEFTYGIDDIAHYYRTYLELMRHWRAVLPGHVQTFCYEDVVEDLERGVRRILEFCALEFEPACLLFYKTDRSIRTASSEQVRQPIFRESLLQWRNYEPWLDPLKEALGDALVRWRE